MDDSELTGTVTEASWTEEESESPLSHSFKIKGNELLDNAACQESVEMCRYCTNSYINKVDVLMHTATHARVVVERLPVNKISEMIQAGKARKLLQELNNTNKHQIRLTNEKHRMPPTFTPTTVTKANANIESSLNEQRKLDTVLKAKQQILKLTGRYPRGPKKRDKHKPGAVENVSVDKAKWMKPLSPKSIMTNKLIKVLAEDKSETKKISLQNYTPCMVNLEPMICDADAQDLTKTAGGPLHSMANGIVKPDSNDTTNTVNLLSSFTSDCRVVLDNPLIHNLVPETKAANADQALKEELLNNFTAECKVILGPQMVFDEETSAETPLSHPAALPEAPAPGSDDEEPVNILNQNDYDSLITPLICYCPRCPQVFPNRFDLYKHNSSHLRVTFTAAMPITVTCSVCPTAKIHEAEPQGNTDASNKYTIHCAACNRSFACVKNFLRHAANHVKETLSLEERRLFPSRSPVFKECEACYRSAKSLRRLIGHLVFEGRTEVQCSICRKLRSVFRLFWKPRSNEVNTVVIDLCDDEPTESVNPAQGRLNFQTVPVFTPPSYGMQTFGTNQGLICSAWNPHADLEMATLTPNTPNSDHSMDILNSIFGPPDSNMEDVFILGGPDPDESLKKDFINTVWEHAFSESQDSTPVPVQVNSNTKDSSPVSVHRNDSTRLPETGVPVRRDVNTENRPSEDWDDAISTVRISKSLKRRSNDDFQRCSKKAITDKNLSITERFVFEEDFTVNPKPPAKRGRPVSVAPHHVDHRRKPVTNAMRLKNIQRKLKTMKQRSAI